MKIALIGMTGCGKSTVGAELAVALEYAFFDVDQVIQTQQGDSVANIFANHGEDHFRHSETTALRYLLDKTENAVIACGGGIVIRQENRELLENKAFTVLLVRPAEIVLSHPEIVNRPPINGDPKKYHMLLEQRQQLYSETAQLTVDATNVADAVSTILKKLEKFTTSGE